MKKNKDNDRVIFTKQMKKDYTILMPTMLPIHMRLLEKTFKLHGYKVVLLETNNQNIVDEGLKNVHNDTCYPALLVIGQLLDALHNGGYDINKTALIITQTGGGCRASNYIHLLRKALKQGGMGHIPVISLNISGLEKNPGFKLTLALTVQLIYAVIYGDLLTWLANQTRPYEINSGETDRLVVKWEDRLSEEYKKAVNLRLAKIKSNMVEITKDFATIQKRNEKKIRVGVVGEIYIKYAPLGNNNLEKFLADEGCEVVVPGLLDFLIFKADNRVDDVNIYGGSKIKKYLINKFIDFMLYLQRTMKKIIEENSSYVPVTQYRELRGLITNDYVGYGNKMGEGWLLTAEMLDLCHMGVNNIVCTQPFGCLPNHIAGKGMIRKIKENYPSSNIVAIDYDPGATKVNQENRIKLMLANAKEISSAQ
ncbi:MAG: 2-hydroxyacyl-CoA dehydratase [Clostridia bacterium]|nr:2-hydroxyacyl-CoA dehydratase [Clostridia bacterium]